MPGLSVRPKPNNDHQVYAVIRIEEQQYQRAKIDAETRGLCMETGVNGCKIHSVTSMLSAVSFDMPFLFQVI